jgi:hypothetical protein
VHWLDVNDHRHLVGEQETVRDVLADLPFQHGLKQERLSHDAVDAAIEVCEEQSGQLQAGFADHVVAHGR